MTGRAGGAAAAVAALVLVAQASHDQQSATCSACGHPLTCEWHPVNGQCDNTPSGRTTPL